MKLSLVVKASGKQEGKVIPITLPQFVVGRDPQCQLRPASPMISKRHCALLQRDGKVYIRDFGSTNGTFVNDQPVKDEQELRDGETLKIGPLVFEVRLIQEPPAARGATPKPPTRAVAAKAAAGAPTAVKTPPPPTKASGGADDDEIAAMLLSLQDDGPSPSGSDPVPEGSTVMDLTLPPGVEDPAKAGDKAKDKPKSLGNTSSAAKSILEQYMKRPRS